MSFYDAYLYVNNEDGPLNHFGNIVDNFQDRFQQ